MIQPELRAQCRSQHLDSKHMWEVAARFQVMTGPRRSLETTHQNNCRWSGCLRETETSKVSGHRATVCPLRLPGTISISCSGQVLGRPRGRWPEDDTEQSPGQLCHSQKTPLTNDFFPGVAIVQIKLWESANKVENLSEPTLPAKMVLNLAVFEREKLG